MVGNDDDFEAVGEREMRDVGARRGLPPDDALSASGRERGNMASASQDIVA